LDITYGDFLNAVRGSENSVAIDVSSTDATFSPPLRRIYVGSTGGVKVDTPDHTGVTYAGVPTGSYIFCRATKVYHTGTSASSLVGEY
jgi:hypothetical protein